MRVFWFLTAVLFLANQGLGASPQVQKVAKRYLPVLEKLAGEKALIREVLARDATPITDDRALKIQEAWSHIGISSLERPYLYNGASETIRTYQSKIPSMFKCFVLDRQGNVVGTVPECKDFIHGQMDKFTKCFNGGQGRVYINPPKLDVSTEIYSVQVSVPVFNQGQTVGVLVASLSLE
jgi:hypothetical protein